MGFGANPLDRFSQNRENNNGIVDSSFLGCINAELTNVGHPTVATVQDLIDLMKDLIQNKLAHEENIRLLENRVIKSDSHRKDLENMVELNNKEI